MNVTAASIATVFIVCPVKFEDKLSTVEESVITPTAEYENRD